MIKGRHFIKHSVHSAPTPVKVLYRPGGELVMDGVIELLPGHLYWSEIDKDHDSSNQPLPPTSPSSLSSFLNSNNSIDLAQITGIKKYKCTYSHARIYTLQYNCHCISS